MAFDSAVLLGQISAGNSGDVAITTTGSLDAAPGLPNGTVNFTANNLTLRTTDGEIGNAISPIAIQGGGIVKADALHDIAMQQQSGPLHIDQIVSTDGDVTIDPDDSPILNANDLTWADEVTDAASQQTWQDLGLTDPAASPQSQCQVAAFEYQMNIR